MRTIKKYPNRRLYDTETSAYITLAEVKALVLSQCEFQVLDVKTNQDITRSILMQIILEEEGGAAPLFSSDMLSQMIRSYGNAMQGAMGSYLEKGMQSFIEVQAKLQEQASALMGDAPKLSSEAWAQFLNAQSPALQGLMGNYLQQSANVFLEMQSKMQKQTREMLGAFSFGVPGEGAPGEAGVAPAAANAPTEAEVPPPEAAASETPARTRQKARSPR